METTADTKLKMRETLISLRHRASELASQSEDVFLLADIVAMLSGKKLPCTYTKEEFADVLNEADNDFKAGRFVTQEELRARYDL
ncbi:MAG: hypothetical protein J6W06_09745 [Bacteroidales bacterium]|jgi:hypothetical protein|nr:hypothetical protein [Bacteroidales bacterium]